MASKSTSLLVYRIGDARYSLFDGRGAMLNGGRWNSPGHPVIYGSLSQAGAMLEILVHASIGKLPVYSKMIVIKIPATLSVETVNANKLPGWDQLNLTISRQFGDTWLKEQRSIALIIPSVVASHDHNIMINQLHPEFSKIKSDEPESLEWDQRLFNW